MSRIHQLSQCLVERFGISEQESAEFVTALFETIRETLLKDKIVKVKGLGTFKLAEMNPRESVDVNTGERITIEGRYKLSFTPENAVRDRINSPFSSFESIDLDDEMDFSEIDKKYEISVQESPETSIEAEPVPVEPEPTPAEPIEVNTVIAETLAVETPEEPEVEEKPAETETLVEPEPDVPAESETAVEEDPETSAESEVPAVSEPELETRNLNLETSVSEPSASETVRAPFCEELIRTDMDHSEKIISLLRWVIGLVIALILCVGGYFAYNVARDRGWLEVKNKPVEVEKPELKPAPVAVDTTLAEKDTIQVEEELQKDTLVAENKEPEVKKNNDIPDQTLYNKDVRVRTGAYYIMGLDREVTVQKGQTFAGICKAYLGEGMECYVEVFNGGITDVKPGSKIKIPKVKPKKRLRK